MSHFSISQRDRALLWWIFNVLIKYPFGMMDVRKYGFFKVLMEYQSPSRIEYWRWNSQNTYLCLQHRTLSVILYYLKGKLLRVISWKLPWFFFSGWRIFCENFKQQCWFVLLLKQINKMGATWFGIFSVHMGL